MTIATRLYTALFGQLVGQDDYGNRYYQRKGPAHGDSSISDNRKRATRWVLYKGMAEPSKVPPQWHGWLHYTHDLPPGQNAAPRHNWEKPPQPNLTGTPGAYLPPGHLAVGGRRAASTSDYEAWKP